MQTERTVRTIRCSKDVGSIKADNYGIRGQGIEIYIGKESPFDAP